MELADAIHFIRERRNGVLITVRGNGRPQSSNIAYVVTDPSGAGGAEEARILISVTESRAKTKNLRRTPQATLHVNREDFWAYAAIEADVELSPVAAAPDDASVDALVDYYRAVAGEHDNWDEYRAAMVNDGRLLLTLTPTHAYGML